MGLNRYESREDRSLYMQIYNGRWASESSAKNACNAQYAMCNEQ